MVIGDIADTALAKKVYIIYNTRRGGDQFSGNEDKVDVDAKGHFSFDTKLPANLPYCPAILYLGDGSEHDFLLQTGKTLNIKVAKDKHGKVILSFKGDNADAAKFLYNYGNAYNYSEFFTLPGETSKYKPGEDVAEIKARYTKLAKEVKEIRDPELRHFLTTLNDDARVNFLSRLTTDKREKDSLYAKIDPNSWIGLYNYLPLRFIEEHMDTTVHANWGGDMTDYGLEYMRTIKKYITDPDVRHALLDDCAKVTINYGKDFKDIDAFWRPFCEFAGNDSSLIKEYAFKVNSLKATKPGMKATDFTFNDRDGNTHKLSDFLGKTVYIDCWATWCGPCCKEIPFLEKRVAEYKDNDKVVFISISCDQNQKAWLTKLDKDKPEWAQFIVTPDQNRIMSKAYGINAIPRFMVIKSDGTIGNSDAFRPSDEDFHKQLDAFLE